MARRRRRVSGVLTRWVDGCDYQVGDQVLVVNRGGDAAMVTAYFGERGAVRALNFKGLGQRFPHDPLICVRLADGRNDGFWSEELLPVALRVPAQLTMPWLPARTFCMERWCAQLFADPSAQTLKSVTPEQEGRHVDEEHLYGA